MGQCRSGSRPLGNEYNSPPSPARLSCEPAAFRLPARSTTRPLHPLCTCVWTTCLRSLPDSLWQDLNLPPWNDRSNVLLLGHRATLVLTTSWNCWWSQSTNNMNSITRTLIAAVACAIVRLAVRAAWRVCDNKVTHRWRTTAAWVFFMQNCKNANKWHKSNCTNFNTAGMLPAWLPCLTHTKNLWNITITRGSN